MINGDPKAFIEGLHYGDEHYFVYDGRKYFIQGYGTENGPMLEVFGLDPDNFDYHWRVYSSVKNKYPVAEFESARIFNGKTFWEVEQEIEWVDE